MGGENGTFLKAKVTVAICARARTLFYALNISRFEASVSVSTEIIFVHFRGKNATLVLMENILCDFKFIQIILCKWGGALGSDYVSTIVKPKVGCGEGRGGRSHAKEILNPFSDIQIR